MQSIHQQLITFGLFLSFREEGVERLSPARAEEVRVWTVYLTGPTGAVLTDRYRATLNEYQAMRNGETTVTEQYMKDLIHRLEAVERTGSGNYEDWLTFKGVGFGVNVPDTQANQAFWKARFDNDVRCFKGFQLLLGSRELVADFFSTTIR